MSGYEAISRDFSLAQYQISIMHGKMNVADKDYELQCFLRGENQIMVATPVIEVGVNVPNASVMVIENAERFGLSKLHQLRGLEGRGADESQYLLPNSFELSNDGKERNQTMVRTQDGFEIAEVDLKLHGSGNIEETQLSGMLRLLLADLACDGQILTAAREIATCILEADPALAAPEHGRLRIHLASEGKEALVWSRILGVHELQLRIQTGDPN